MKMYECCYDYIKPKYKDKAKLCYTDTDRFIIHIETEYFYKDIADDVKNRSIHLIMMKIMKERFKQARTKT